jgi:hypothetical protein
VAVIVDARRATVLSVLEADGKKIEPLLEDAPLAEPQREVGLVSPDPWADILSRVGQELARILDGIGISSVLLAGWRKYDDLVDAARATRDTTESLPVELAGHTMSLRQHPRVDVTWGERTIASVPFQVVVEIRVVAATGTVRGGSLVEISTGRCDLDVSVGTMGEKRTIQEYSVDPRWVAGLGEGIRLVE